MTWSLLGNFTQEYFDALDEKIDNFSRETLEETVQIILEDRNHKVFQDAEVEFDETIKDIPNLSDDQLVEIIKKSYKAVNACSNGGHFVDLDPEGYCEVDMREKKKHV